MTATWRLANQYAIPGTGVMHHGRWLRRPKGAAAALRAAADGDMRPAAIPPDAWDDLPIQALRSRTWKRHRRTQYHPDKPGAQRKRRERFPWVHRSDGITSMTQRINEINRLEL